MCGVSGVGEREAATPRPCRWQNSGFGSGVASGIDSGRGEGGDVQSARGGGGGSSRLGVSSSRLWRSLRFGQGSVVALQLCLLSLCRRESLY